MIRIAYYMVFAMLLSVVAPSYGQTDLKTNGPLLLIGIPNISVETSLSNKFTFNTDLVWSPWTVKGNHLRIVQLIPEVRFYPREGFRGFYTGVYSGLHSFKLTKWNYWNKNYYSKGWGFAFGVTIGYNLRLSRRVGLDFYAGGGWHVSRYRGYSAKTNTQTVPLNNSAEWLPYKSGVTLTYRIGHEKQRKGQQ